MQRECEWIGELTISNFVGAHQTRFVEGTATLDSIECVLEVDSFSELAVFLELLFVNVLQELPQDL